MDNSIGNQKTMGVARQNDRSMGNMPTMGGTGRLAGKRFQVGEVILGRYRVLSELGQGGMGVVYRCFDDISGIEVALKALPPEVARNSGEMDEVRENFKLVEKLHHPNIANVKTLELDAVTGDFYLIMECVDGYDIRQWARKRRDEGRALTLDEVGIIAYRLAEALDYAHEQKIIHRDIKPSNVRVNFDGDVKVLDFGLAAQIHTSMSRVSMAYKGTSGTGPYMAPEQWRGLRQGPAADQYALAATVYELLSGDPPFVNHDISILREVVLKEPAQPIEGVPEHVNSALLKALAKEPTQRFASCKAFVEALSGRVTRGVIADAQTRVHPGALREGHALRDRGRADARPSRAWLWLASAAVIVIFAAVSIGAVLAHNAKRAETARAATAAAQDAVQREQDERRKQEALAAEAKKIAGDNQRLKAERAQLATERKAQEEQERIAKEKQTLQPAEGKPWTSPAAGMEFVWIPVLKIWVGKYEVTNSEYRKKEKAHDSKDYQGNSLYGERQPVVYVNFDDAVAYAAWLTERDKAQLGGLRYRVPSEAEWMVFAQCGDGREYPWGNSMPPKYGNYGKTSGYDDGYAVSIPVEKSARNDWGLYGVGGNVWECCATGASGSSFGAWRGASWYCDFSGNLRCACRILVGSARDNDDGFRLVVSR